MGYLNLNENNQRQTRVFLFNAGDCRVKGACAGFSRLGVALALALLIIAGGAAWWFFADSGSGSERAIPKVDASHQLFVKIGNPEIFKSKLKAAASHFGSLQKMPAFPLSGDYTDAFANNAGLIEWAGELLNSAEEAAFLIAGNEEGKDILFCLAFTPKKNVFDKLISNPDDSVFLIEEWKQDKGSEGWIVKPSPHLANTFKKPPTLYLLRRNSKRDSSILVSDNPENIDQMKKALANGASRLNVKRYNPAPDFLQGKLPVKTQGGDTKTSTTEIAWIEDETSAHMQFYTNVFSLQAGRAVPKSGLRGDDLPLLGNGNLAFVAGIDIPYACFVAHPMASDPVMEVLGEYLKQIPMLFPYKEDLHKVMSDGRISAVAVEEDGEKNDYSTGYLVLETKAKDSMERLTSFPKGMMRKDTLAGWDSCYTFNVGGKFKPIIFAQRGNIYMAGIGSLDSYSKKARILPEIKDFAAPKDLANLVATATLWEMAKTSLNMPLTASIINSSFLRDMEIDPCTIQFRMITPEKADIGFYWTKPLK